MHSVDILEEALQLASDSGFAVRQEWLGEKGGGACRIGNHWHLFVDLSLTADEQLRQVIEALQRSDHLNLKSSHSPALKRLLATTRVA